MLIGVALVVVYALAVLNLDRLANRVADHPLPEVSGTAKKIHLSATVIDMHSDALMWNRDLLQEGNLGHVDLPRLRQGGVAVQGFSVPTNFPIGPGLFHRKSERWPDYFTSHALLLRWPRRSIRSSFERTLYMARKLETFSARSDGDLQRITTQSDLDRLLSLRASGADSVGALLALEGAHVLEGDLDKLQRLHDVGFRMVGLTHFIDTPFAGSATGMHQGGLTPKGVRLIAEAERLGLVIDLAHASHTAIRDVVRATSRPVVVSHTGIRATCDMERNLSDEEIRWIAEADGVIGVAFGEILICGDKIEDIVASIQHVVNLVGDRHIALGSDFDGCITSPIDVSHLPSLTQAMLDAGFAQSSIVRILGGNTLRVLRANLPGPRSATIELERSD